MMAAVGPRRHSWLYRQRSLLDAGWCCPAVQTEHLKGSIEPGKLADLTVLSEDPTAVAGDRIAGLQVLATIVDGEIRHHGGLS